MPSFFRRFVRVGRLPAALRAELEPEGVLAVAERVPVRQRFSGSVPGRSDGLAVSRHIGLVVCTRRRLYALIPTMPRLGGPAIDQRWDAARGGPATVSISGTGVTLKIDLDRVDPRFHGDLSMTFATEWDARVLAALPADTLTFGVSADYVFHCLGVRARP